MQMNKNQLSDKGREGYWEEVHGNLTYKINYKNNVLHGLCENYFEGKPQCKGIFKNGRQIGYWQWWHNEQPIITSFYANE